MLRLTTAQGDTGGYTNNIKTMPEKILDSGISENKEQKVTLFGILAGTKVLLNPIKENLEINRQGLEILKNMESSLQKMAVSQELLAENLLKTASILNDLKNKIH